MTKKEKAIPRFDWSRNPSREGIHSVYISTPGSYSCYGKDVTREEMANSLSTWNKINDLNAKKAMFKTLFIAALVSIPFIAIIYNMVSTIVQTSK
jgi:hypothetical protein